MLVVIGLIYGLSSDICAKGLQLLGEMRVSAINMERILDQGDPVADEPCQNEPCTCSDVGGDHWGA